MYKIYAEIFVISLKLGEARKLGFKFRFRHFCLSNFARLLDLSLSAGKTVYLTNILALSMYRDDLIRRVTSIPGRAMGPVRVEEVVGKSRLSCANSATEGS